jgi:hypothetical protein
MLSKEFNEIFFLLIKFKDLFVDRLVQQVDTLREQISMYEYQLRIQSKFII